MRLVDALWESELALASGEKKFVNTIIKTGLLIAGWLSFCLGAIGVVLPVLPTTPFMLLAAACFAKSSHRFHHWLLNSRVFGQLIQNWQNEQFIERNAKIRALIIVALTFSISIIVVDPVALKVMLIVCWSICTFFMSRLPTIPRSQRVRGQS